MAVFVIHCTRLYNFVVHQFETIKIRIQIILKTLGDFKGLTWGQFHERGVVRKIPLKLSGIYFEQKTNNGGIFSLSSENFRWVEFSSQFLSPVKDRERSSPKLG